eukprot:gene10914-22781_t
MTAFINSSSLNELAIEDLICNQGDVNNFIGTGGFADIYKGVLKGSTPVAIKYIKQMHINTDDIVEYSNGQDEHEHDIELQFLHEAQMMTLCIDCPYIVKILGVQFEDIHIRYKKCIVMELEFLHQLNICHNDIKPDNFLLYPNGTLKLADFGLSDHLHKPQPTSKNILSAHKTRRHQKYETKSIVSPKKPFPTSTPSSPTAASSPKHAQTQPKLEVEEDTSMEHIPSQLCVGNPVYQAPELFIYPPKLSFSSDIYAYSILFNEMLTNCKPLHSLHTTAMLPIQICGGIRPSPIYNDHVEVEDRDEVTKRIQHIIKIGWDGRAKDRPAAKAVASGIRRILELLRTAIEEEELTRVGVGVREEGVGLGLEEDDVVHGWEVDGIQGYIMRRISGDDVSIV